MTTRLLAVVPARGGSKGIPGKNMAALAGKPLLWWTLHAAKNALCVTDIAVSSDDPKILAYTEKCGAIAVKRPHQLATDTAKTEPVIQHLLTELHNKNETYDELLLLQPTSPLRSADHIDSACTSWRDKQSDALISVEVASSSVLKSFFVDQDGQMSGVVNNAYPFMPRQQLPEVYKANGAMYFVKVPLFTATGTLFQPNTAAYLMDAESSIDIDLPADLEAAEKIIYSRSL